MEEEIDHLRGGQFGTIRISLSPLAAVKIVPEALVLFRHRFPEVEVHLSSGLYPGTLKTLEEGLIDMHIGPTPPEHLCRNLDSEFLPESPINLITSAESPAANATSLAQLVDCRWIMIGGREGPGDIFDEPFLAHGLTPPRVTTTSESYFGAMSLVEKLGAVCTFPTKLFAEVESAWNVSKINIKEQIDPLKISLLTRSGQPLTPAASALANCVRVQVNSM